MNDTAYTPAEVQALASGDPQAGDIKSAVAAWARDAAQAAQRGCLDDARNCLERALGRLGALEARLGELEAQR